MEKTEYKRNEDKLVDTAVDKASVLSFKLIGLA